MKTGIFGGTFDPVHNGHIEIAKKAAEELELEKLIVLPAGDPPHKKDAEVTDKYERLAMCELAFSETGFDIDDFEIKKSEPSYTFETLGHFAKDFDDIYFIVGGDSLKNITGWKNPERIFELAKVFAIGREVDAENELTKKFADRIIRSHSKIPDISSTEIRIKRRFGLDVSDLTSKRVNDYIEEKGLYKKDIELTQRIKKYLKESRYLHTVNVAVEAVENCKRLCVDEEDAFLAAALHDVAKYVDPTPYKSRLIAEGVVIPPSCVHAFVGSYIAKDVFEIEDEKILNAIKYHTTGRPNMTGIEKLVFLSDITEKGRSFEGVEKIRELANKNIDEAIEFCFEETIKRIKKEDLCSLTSDALKYLKRSK